MFRKPLSQVEPSELEEIERGSARGILAGIGRHGWCARLLLDSMSRIRTAGELQRVAPVRVVIGKPQAGGRRDQQYEFHAAASDRRREPPRCDKSNSDPDYRCQKPGVVSH